MSRAAVTDRMPDFAGGNCQTRDARAVFDDITNATVGQAVAICTGCPVQVACREWGISHEDQGVWGGLTKDGLRAERASRNVRRQVLRSGKVVQRPPKKKPESIGVVA